MLCGQAHRNWFGGSLYSSDDLPHNSMHVKVATASDVTPDSRLCLPAPTPPAPRYCVPGESQGQCERSSSGQCIEVNSAVDLLFVRYEYQVSLFLYHPPFSHASKCCYSYISIMMPFGLLAFTASVLPLISAQNNSATFTNPVLNEVGADPFVAKDGGYYYMTYTTATNITILRSTSLTDWDNADVKLAFDPPVCLKT